MVPATKKAQTRQGVHAPSRQDVTAGLAAQASIDLGAISLFFKGAHSNDLYTAWLDGTTWHGNTGIKTQPGNINPQSDMGPAACLYNNRLYLAYKDSESGDLCMATYDGIRWHDGTRISSQPGGISPASDYAPGLVAYDGLLYMVYKGCGSSDIYVAWFDGTTWFGNQRIADMPGGISPQTNDCLHPTVFQGKLYLVYRGATFRGLYTATFDGTTWSGDTKISDQPGGIDPDTNYNPGTVAFNGCLYLVYKGSHSNALYSAWFDGTTWSGDTMISDQPGGISPASNDSPSVYLYANKLFLVYKGAVSRDLYTATFDGTTWSDDTKISSQPGGIDPATNYNPSLAILPFSPGKLTNWLAAVPDQLAVCDINLPGTHDSAAINTWLPTTPYACHNSSITDQLESGVRLLDVRLKVELSGSTYSFVTCHGDIGANEYQTFPSLLDECKAFLTSNRTEFIAMSVKVDDWNGVTDKSAAGKALASLLAMYPTSSSGTIPTLGDLRGKIYLLSRIGELPAGVPISWSDNTSGQSVPPSGNRKFSLYVQDQYEDLPFFSPASAKLGLFKAAMDAKSPGVMELNFASATQKKIFGVYIIPGVLELFGEKAAGQRPTQFGWSLFDYETENVLTDTYGYVGIVPFLVSSNFGYRGFELPFKLGSGKDDL